MGSAIESCSGGLKQRGAGTRLSKTFTSAADISRPVEYREDPCLRAGFECASADKGTHLSRPIITGVLTIVLSIPTPLLFALFQ